VEITPTVVKRYQTDRLAAKAAPKTINDEVLLLFPAGKGQPNDPAKPVTTLRTAWTKEARRRALDEIAARHSAADDKRSAKAEQMEQGAGASLQAAVVQ
jgi:hypothetical protein